MNRRQILLGALATAALMHAPLAVAALPPAKRRVLLSQAWERAVERGCPLLVIIVPEGDIRADLRERQHRLGGWLHHATEPELAALAQVEGVCASLSELDRLVPGVASAREAWMVLVRVDQGPPTWRSIVVKRAFSLEWRKEGRQAMRATILRVFESEGLVPSSGRAELARQAQERWVHQPPPGATWGSGSSCPTCGMGHISESEMSMLNLTTPDLGTP